MKRRKYYGIHILLICFSLLIATKASYATEDCQSAWINIGNSFRKMFGFLPDSVQIRSLFANDLDKKLWQSYLMNRKENLFVEILNLKKERISHSEIITSGNYSSVNAKDALGAMYDALKIAHSNTVLTNGWTIRFVHNHPSGAGHSMGDIKISIHFKEILEEMGYTDASLQFDVLLNSNTIYTYTLPPEISRKNNSYASTKKKIDKEFYDEIRNTKAQYEKNKIKFNEALESQFHVITKKIKIEENMSLLEKSSIKNGETYFILSETTDLNYKNSKAGNFDSNVSIELGLVYLLFDSQIMSFIQLMESKKELVVFLSLKGGEKDSQKIIQSALNFRAVLDALDFKNHLTIHFLDKDDQLKEFSLQYNFNINGVQYLSEIVQRLIEKIKQNQKN